MNEEIALESKEFEIYTTECEAAMRMAHTRIENLLSLRKVRGGEIPCSIVYRTKTFDSTMEKCARKGYGCTIESIKENVRDIAGIRIITLFKSDIYKIAELIEKAPGLNVVQVRDYVQKPKPNGYSSLHIHVQIEIYSDEGSKLIPVEIQIRTKAMDLWAELEHYLYKNKGSFPDEFKGIFKQTANALGKFDNFGDQIKEKISENGDATN